MIIPVGRFEDWESIWGKAKDITQPIGWLLFMPLAL
jgi:hypothetical protein